MVSVSRALALVTLTTVTACAAPIRSTISPGALRQAVEAAEVERDAASPALPKALSAQQRELRIAALRALARTAETGTSSLAMALLGDRDEEVARWAAFALGQTADRPAETALVGALGGVSPAPDAVLMALGRAGTATAARDVSAKLGDASPKVRAAAALALGLIGKRIGKAFPAELYASKVLPLLADPDRDVRFAGAYALLRLPGPTAAVALIPILGDADAELRATAARGLGLSAASPAVLDAVLQDAGWRVRVEAARALGAIGKARPKDAPASAQRLMTMVPRELERMKAGVLESGLATHVLLAVIGAALDLGDEGVSVVKAAEKAPWSANDLPRHAAPDLARVSCAIAHALDQAEGVIRRVRGCGDATMHTWRRDQLVARLLGASGTDDAVKELVELSGHQDPRVRVAAIEGLQEIEKASAVQALARLLESNDPFVRAAAADALARPDRAAFRPKGLVDALGRVLDAALADPDPSYAVPVLDALGTLGEAARPLVPKLESLATDPRPAIRRRAAKAREVITGQTVPFGRGAGSLAPRPAPITTRPRLALDTVRGPVVVELFGDVAPATTGALVALAQRGFYDDRTFHRIVSDFVAQGGCPRGDGYGGPGFALDEEVSMLPFVRGALGIATSGRDTGGSQFFVMHAYHPHLDGGYAVVGRVVEGMDVVDALQQDDLVRTVRPQ